MQKCPCCGSFADLTAVSFIRKGDILICGKCEDLELDGKGRDRKEWAVDQIGASQALRDFFSMSNNYFDMRECSDDKVYLAKLERQYEKAKENRTEKFVVMVESEDGSSPLAEFVDENLARAKVFGWLSDNFTPTGSRSWVSMYGAVISIDEM